MEQLLEGIYQGKERAIARGITLIENNRAEGAELLKQLYPETELAYLVGITGPPGSGKSTLSSRIVQKWREKGFKVGIIAIDPSSKYSGGAILGDRIRMGEIVPDRGVFIRSMATRGSLGGLNPAIFDTILLLSAAGYQYILIETVGVGQNEIDIVNLADTTLVVTVPEAGDEVQAFKAGLMEVGDIFIVNKADRPEVNKMELMIKQMLAMSENYRGDWQPPVVTTIASRGEGVTGLTDEIEKHHNYLKQNKIMQNKREEMLRRQLVHLMEDQLRKKYLDPITGSDLFNTMIDDIIKLKTDPYSAAEGLLKMKGGAGKDED